MSPTFIASILGLTLAVMTLAQVSPSVLQVIAARKVVTGVGREEAIVQQVIRYAAAQNGYPATMQDLIDKGYWQTSDNNNGFGGTYSFAIDTDRKLIAVTTTIADSQLRQQYLNNYRHIYRPVDNGNNTLTTTFILPSYGLTGAPVPSTGSIPVSSVAPDAGTNTYWYDTSGSTPVLKVSDGTTWVSVAAPLVAPNIGNTLNDATALPASGATGDVRYVYTGSGNALITYVLYNGIWVPLGSMGGAGVCPGGVSGNGNPISYLACILATYVSANSTCGWTDGYLGTDATPNYYACQDTSINTDLTGTTCITTSRVTYDVNGNTYICTGS